MAETPVTRLRHIQARMEIALARAGRPSSAAQLVAISKTFEEKEIVPLLEAGHRRFGENRVQEAKRKWGPLKARFPGVELHLVGPLQTNKVDEAVALFDVIETLDRPKLAAALARAMAALGRRPKLFVQVNIGREPQKSGVAPEAALDFIRACPSEHGLDIQGLMAIPPAGAPPEPFFEALADLARQAALPFLSMGMSDDFEAALRCGATHVRVGTAIFGPR